MAKTTGTPPETDEMRIEYMRLDELKRAPRNPQGHDISEIDGAIKRFGFIDLVVIDESTGSMVAGHGRLDTLETMRERGDEPPRRIRVDDDGMWLVPTQRGVDFSDQVEAEAYLLAANRIQRLGVDDEFVMSEMLSDIAEQATLLGTGFDEVDMANMLAGLDTEVRHVGGSQAERLERRDTSEIRQIVLILRLEEFDHAMERLASIREEFPEMQSNSDVFLWLLDRDLPA